MMIKSTLKAGVFSLLAIGAASGSNAATMIFYDRTAFTAVSGPLTIETFNSFASQTSFAASPLDVGPFSLSVTPGAASGERNSIDIPPLQFSQFNVDGTTIANVLITTGQSFFINFDQAVNSFGADFAQLNDSTLRTQFVINGETFNPLLDQSFVGFTSTDPFSVVEFRAVGNDGFGMDNVSFSSVGPAVPEPGTWAMMLLGFGFVGGAMRSAKRRQKVTASYA